MVQPRAGGRFDWGLFILVVVASQGFSAFLPGDQSRTSLVLASAMLAFLVIREPNRALAAAFSGPLVFFFIAWSLAATLMSQHTVDALYLTGVQLLMIVYCVMRRSSTKHTLEVFALATTVSLVPSIAGLFLAPLGVSVREHAGSVGGYAGYFPWNSSAGLCAAAALLSLAWVIINTRLRWWHLPAVAAALVIFFKAESATSKFAFAAAAGTFLAQIALRRVSPRVRPMAFCALGIAAILLVPKAVRYVSDFSAVGEIADRTSTLSGRTTVWGYALDGIFDSPYWGYGAKYWDRFGEWPTSAHNGFLDVALTVGVPGAIALCAIIFVAGVRLALSSSPLLPFLVFGVVANLVVSQIGVPAVTSLALWLAVGATVRVREAKGPKDVVRPTMNVGPRPITV